MLLGPGIGPADPLWYPVPDYSLPDTGVHRSAGQATAHYHKIVTALTETVRLMKDINKVIEQHGGWPDAFVTEIPVQET